MALPQLMLAACAVAPTSDGSFLVLGRSPDGPAVWASADGAAWTDPALVDADSDESCGDYLIAVAGGFLAGLNASGKSTIATSRDGISWERTEVPGMLTPSHRIAALGDLVVAFTHRLQADGQAEPVLFLGVIGP
jgi:hypothetical protein